MGLAGILFGLDGDRRALKLIELKNCTPNCPRGLAERFDAKALDERHLVILDDGDGHPGYANLRSRRFDTVREIRRRRSESNGLSATQRTTHARCFMRFPGGWLHAAGAGPARP